MHIDNCFTICYYNLLTKICVIVKSRSDFMSKAILSYALDSRTNNDVNELILLSGSLKMIDNCTKEYKSTEEMRQSAEFKERIDDFINLNAKYIAEHNISSNGNFTVAFIADSENREYLPILLDDKKIIRTRTSALEEVKSEVERARKLLFRSRDKLFLRRMLKDERFADTTDFDIKLKLSEYKEVIKKGMTPKLIDGEYYLTIEQILQYALEVDKAGVMRGLIEDALEVWKDNLLSLDDDLLYYYSRHLRIAINAYDRDKVNKKVVTNLRANILNMVDAVNKGPSRIVHHNILGKSHTNIKTKRMED